MQPTKETYDQLDRAYDHFNAALFEGRLPSCVLVLHRKKNARGYFWGDTWIGRASDGVTDEIALNPEVFKERSDAEILSTLVHEMCHLEQHHFGKPSRSGYHNAEWAKMMRRVGLIPTDTGALGGKETGQRVTHVIEAGGVFETACAALIDTGFALAWQARTGDAKTAKKKAASKTKYTCAGCGANAWAKPATALICGACMEPMRVADDD